MRPARKPYPIYENVRLTDAGTEGQSIGKYNDLVVFATGGVPGDLVDIQIHKKKKNYAEGKVVAVKEPSTKRSTPFCSHFGVCGGCKWQHMDYQWQLYYKQKQVEDNLKRIGKLELPTISPIIGSEQTEFYRNKLEFTFSSKKWLTAEEMGNKEEITRNGLGFHIPKLFDKVLDIDQCYLQAEPSNSIREALRNFALDQHLTFYDIREHHGLLRNLIIRTTQTGQVMVIVCFGEKDEAGIQKVMQFLQQTFPRISSLMYIVNLKLNDSTSDQDVILFANHDHLLEEMEGLKFRVSPKSFYQTNSEQAYVLYKVAREFAGLTGNEVVYDLYTGTGTIANFVAKQAKKVVGIEYVADAIADAKVNSEINGIENTHFFAGDMKDVLTAEFVAAHGQPQVVITDPPRMGMHPSVVQRLLEMNPEKIVYVSCNPSTQARDLELLAGNYAIAKVQPVDMFPQTHHVENVVLLTRIN